MNHYGTPIAALSRRALSFVFLAVVLLSARVAKAEENHSDWSINMTPVLLLPSGDERFGGGIDPR